MKRKTLKITLHDQTYSLNKFCKLYDLSYSTAYRYYMAGLRDEDLFDALFKQKYQSVSVLGKSFSTLKDASRHYKIPYTTFLRQYKNGTLNTYLHNHKKEVNQS